MAGCVKPLTSRRFTDPTFNQKVRQRILGLSSSPNYSATSTTTSSSTGSEHDGAVSISSLPPPSPSPCLSHLLHDYFLDGFDDSAATAAVSFNDNSSSDDDEDDRRPSSSSSDPASERYSIQELSERTANTNNSRNADRFRRDLLRRVSRATESLSLFRRNRSAFNRSVMAYLRECGYDAGVCKTKWDASVGGSLTAGSYEFIDVVVRSPSPPSLSSYAAAAAANRYIVDVDFAAQFEIARETDRYRRVLAAVPRVFVGREEDLRKVVRVMADEARRSMRTSEISLPPWRKHRYLQAKWFGPYQRTTNQLIVPRRSASDNAGTNFAAVKCRAVGFFGDGGRVAAEMTRTR